VLAGRGNDLIQKARCPLWVNRHRHDVLHGCVLTLEKPSPFGRH
jgi:hypothetical protein